MSKWIGVDLDGTLATHVDDHDGGTAIGSPVPAMVKRVQQWLSEGKEVRILTARVAWGWDDGSRKAAIREWCIKHIGQPLHVTAEKDPGMIELWDDRAVQVIRNTGVVVDAVSLNQVVETGTNGKTDDQAA